MPTITSTDIVQMESERAMESVKDTGLRLVYDILRSIQHDTEDFQNRTGSYLIQQKAIDALNKKRGENSTDLNYCMSKLAR